MEKEISKSKIDKLGDQLRKGNIADSDLRLLDEYRRSFTDAYDAVAGAIREQLNLEPTGRPAKSTTSITDKLRRESIRLSQIQDIAGCRLVVSDTTQQDHVIASLVELFPKTTVIDRRQKPSHGYRAVHVIAIVDRKTVEIQVRTALQQLWAELSEKFSDLVDPAIKYGGGDQLIQEILANASILVSKQEEGEVKLLDVQQRLSRRVLEGKLTEETSEAIMTLQRELDSLQEVLEETRQETIALFRRSIKDLPRE